MKNNRTFTDHTAIALTTFGVGFIPIAPGTWGSAVGVVIYVLFAYFEMSALRIFIPQGWNEIQVTAWVHAVNMFLFLLFCLAGIWAAERSTEIFENKDPQQAVVDEVIGQLLTFLFIPFTFSWFYIGAGFLLFRLFDIWKPYPIDYLQTLEGGVGVCADDILAGVYSGTCLAIIYAVHSTLF